MEIKKIWSKLNESLTKEERVYFNAWVLEMKNNVDIACACVRLMPGAIGKEVAAVERLKIDIEQIPSLRHWDDLSAEEKNELVSQLRNALKKRQ